MHVSGALALVAFATALAFSASGARRAAKVAACGVAVFGVVAVVMYGVAEARYGSCVSGPKALGEDARFAVTGDHFCSRAVFGRVRGDVIR